MTGYGKAECELAQKKVTIEVKSLNSKQLDLNTRIPGVYREKEIEIRRELSDKLIRGKVDFSLFTESLGVESNCAINGALVAGLRLPSIVVTLATMVTWRKALDWRRQGEFVNLPDGGQWFGLSQSAGQWTLIAIALAVLGLLAFATKHLAAGRFIYAMGSDAEAARLAGIRPQLTTFCVFVFMGALVGLAAMMNVAQSPQVDPKSGSGLELKVIAAAVVGGVAVSGGRGKLWGVFVGLLLLVCISPALTHLHVEAYWEKAIQGTIILLAVVADGLRSRKDIKRG